MARDAVTFEQVATIADQIKAAGQNPTVRSVHENLGGGSMGTVLKLLGRWKEGQSLASEKTMTDDSIDPSIARAVSTVMSARIQAAVCEITGRLAELQSEAGDLIVENERQADEIAEHLRKIESQAEEMAIGTGRIAQIEAELSLTRQERDAKAQESGQAKTELAKSLLRLESVPRMEEETQKLRESLRSQEKARAEAEKEAAVATARSESLVRMGEDLRERAESLDKDLQKRVEALAAEAKARAAAEQNAAVLATQAEAMAEKIGELQKREMRLYTELEAERTAHGETRKERDRLTETLIRKGEAEEEEDGPSQKP